jgi:DNA topoisomerase IA
VGLITYMRTDSVRIAEVAAAEAQELIRERFGNNFALEKPRTFRTETVPGCARSHPPQLGLQHAGKVAPISAPTSWRSTS